MSTITKHEQAQEKIENAIQILKRIQDTVVNYRLNYIKQKAFYEDALYNIIGEIDVLHDLLLESIDLLQD